MPEKNARTPSFSTTVLFVRSILGWLIASLLAVAGVYFSHASGFSKLLAAQTSMGVFGIWGGISHVLIMRAVGGRVSWKHGVILSLAWALCCVGAVTPLFFTSGTPLKMAVLAFYSFAMSGALGGVAAAFMMNNIFSKTAPRDPTPTVLMWSFGFGLSAAVIDAINEGLRTFLPVEYAWPVSLIVAVLIIGITGGYSVIHFLRKQTAQTPAWQRLTVDHDTTGGKRALYTVVLILLALPFYLNDFSNIYVTDWRLWILIDYTAGKLFPCGLMIWLILSRKMRLFEFGFTSQPVVPSSIVFLIGTLVGVFIDQNGYLVLDGLRGYPPLGKIPDIDSTLWKWIDLTAGLFMVGICEEFIFRGYMCTYLTLYTRKPSLIIAISALAFGLIHWSGGFHAVIITSIIGAIFMALYLRTSSLPAIMLAHFAVNFIDFANVIPKEIFRFL
jgi:membrane protease YdiL (CAAX protease family)